MIKRKLVITGFSMLTAVCLAFTQEAPLGSITEPSKKEKKVLEGFKGQLNGQIVWSSSRANSKHDIWIMNADGSDPRQLTKGDYVDWFPRFSPDGSKIIFTRSKMGWVPEADGEQFDKWNVWYTNTDGTGEMKIADNASWGSWTKNGQAILFARGPKVFEKDLATQQETLLFDAEESIKKGAFSQQPGLSGNRKFLSITIRGTKRETGIWNLETKTWNSTGGGCQITWFPDSKKILRMNEGHGNGGTEVLALDIDESGKPVQRISGLTVPKDVRFMDVPGRISHEYFPKVDQTGNWLVWCATQYGHEHDIYDYEVFIWKIGTDQKEAVRLTFHTGNDRWPDLYLK